MSLRPVAPVRLPSTEPLVVTHEERRLFSETPPVYLGAVRLSDWSQNARTGIWVRFRLLDVDDADRHPFRGLRWSYKPGDGHRLRVALNILPEDGPDEHVYGGELTLGLWGEDCANGVTVKLWLDPSPALARDRQRLQELRADPKDGDVLSLGCWAIGDDEMPEAPTHTRRGAKVPFAARDATVQAGIKCGDDEFREWCRVVGVIHVPPAEVAALPAFAEDPRGFAEGVVRSLCRVRSRSELKEAGSQGDDARRRWSRILHNYGRWRIDRRGPPPHQGK